MRKNIPYRRAAPWCLALVGLAFFVLTPSYTHAKGDWKHRGRVDGVELYERALQDEEKNVEFRGVTTMKVNVRDLFAVMYDARHRFRWMELMEVHEMVARRSANEQVFYSKFESPFFMVSDRDVITVIRAKFIPEKQIVDVKLWDVAWPTKPPVDDAVRIAKMRGHWVIKALGPNKTWVSYELFTDPGGWIPGWVARRVSRDLPAYTLKRLREESGHERYSQTRRAIEYLFDWSNYP